MIILFCIIQLTPTNVVLKYMAIADLFVGIVPLPWTVFFYTLYAARISGKYANFEIITLNLHISLCALFNIGCIF